MNFIDNAMKKFFTEKIDGYSIVDEATGEINDLYIKRKVDINEFVMMFLLTIDEVNNNLSGNEIKVLLAAVRSSKPNIDDNNKSTFITCSLEFKSLIKGIKPQNVSKYLKKITELGFIIRKTRSEYELNPLYFFRGTLTQRTKCLMNITTKD